MVEDTHNIYTEIRGLSIRKDKKNVFFKMASSRRANCSTRFLSVSDAYIVQNLSRKYWI
jgi:hypothetical protein